MRAQGFLGWLFLLAASLLLALSRPTTAAPEAPGGGKGDPAGLLTATPTPGTATPVLSATPTASGTALAPTATATGGPTACPPAWRGVPVLTAGPLFDVAVVAPIDAWAVSADVNHQAIMRWNGLGWLPVPFPTATDTPVSGPRFFAIAAQGPFSAWAGGAATGNFPAQMQHWDGATWQVITSTLAGRDAPTTTYDFYKGIVALGPNEAYAVRSSGVGVNTFAGLERCTTTGCTPLSSLSPARFEGLSALSPTDIWIVGDAIYHWDGTTLALATTISNSNLFGVAARAPNDVWAVGLTNDTPTAHSLIMHWDGSIWAIVPAPDIGFLADVTALAPDDVWAVGNAILHWDGSAWTVVATPGGILYGVAALAADDIWAVGQDAGNASAILHYSHQYFADVPSTQVYYRYIEWLVCRGIIGGYTCGGPGEPCPASYFRPNATVTRGQLLKMVVNAAGWPLVTPPTPRFADVDAGNPFYAFIETGVSQGIISGYACGGPGEPCDPAGRPYFRPGANITRGQLSKVIALARGYPLPTPPTNTFADVPPTQPFYGFVEAVAAQSIVSGYTCGGPGEPCDPTNRPYFRPGASATRGQVAKFVTLAYGGP